MSELEKARERFKGDIFAADAGIVLEEVGEKYARCSLEISPRHLNAEGTVMGGAIFTLADFTFAVAANHGQCLTVSSSANISFLSGAKGKKLTATSKLIKDGRRSCIFDIDVFDDTGVYVARASISGTRLA